MSLEYSAQVLQTTFVIIFTFLVLKGLKYKPLYTFIEWKKAPKLFIPLKKEGTFGRQKGK